MALLLLLTPLFAQVSAVLSGTVTDQPGGGFRGNRDGEKRGYRGERSAVTDADGHYQFFSLPVGHYEIRGAKTGFTEEVRTGVHLVVGQSATVDMDLRSANRASRSP